MKKIEGECVIKHLSKVANSFHKVVFDIFTCEKSKNDTSLLQIGVHFFKWCPLWSLPLEAVIYATVQQGWPCLFTCEKPIMVITTTC